MIKERGIGREKFEEILTITENIMSPTSLNACVGDDEDSEVGDFAVDDMSPGVEEQVEYTLLKETVAAVLDTLTQRERDIIEQRFGLKGNTAKTLEEMGAQYHVTRERIRQIEENALLKLRHPSRSNLLRSFLLE